MSNTTSLGAEYELVQDDTLPGVQLSNGGTDLVSFEDDRLSSEQPLQLQPIAAGSVSSATSGKTMLFLDDSGILTTKDSSGTSADLVATNPTVTENSLALAGTLAQDNLLSGSVGWKSGLTLTASTLIYALASNSYTATGPTDITLDPADPTLDRIDVIYTDTSNTVAKITGSPGNPPDKPLVQSGTQLEVTWVTVQAAASTPDINTNFVYTDDTYPTWTTTPTTVGGFVLDSTNNPDSGATYSIEGTSLAQGDRVVFSGTALDFSDQTVLQFRIAPKAGYTTSLRILFVFRASTGWASGNIVLDDGDYDFDISSTSYQTISIPVRDFQMTTAEVTGLWIYILGSGTGFYMDKIVLQTGLPQGGALGTDNTAENIGTGGVGVFKQIIGSTLQFKRIRGPGSNMTITDNTDNNTLDIGVAGLTGPNSALDGEVVTFDGTSGTIIKGTGRRNLGPLAADPVGGSPQDGDRYYNTTIHHEMAYDGSRSKWLSVATLLDGCGYNGYCTNGSYYKRFGNMRFRSNTGPYVQKGTIIYIGYTTRQTATHTFDIQVNGSVVASLASGGAASAFDNTVNADFPAGNMNMLNRSGGSSSRDLQAVVCYKLRA